jgi:hypothetical protein
LWKALTKKHASNKKKTPERATRLSRMNPLKRLQNHSLPTYLALRRQKVKFGSLTPIEDSDLEMLVCVPDAVLLED